MKFAGCLAAALLLYGASSHASDPVTIHAGWTNVPTSLMPIFTPKPGITRHLGMSYQLDAQHYASSALQRTGLATGELEVAEQSFAVFALSVTNADLKDIRIIGDVIQDGVEGYAAGSFQVLRDSPIRTIEDLRGKVVATTGIGTSADIIIRAELLKRGLVAGRDYTDVEASYASMKPMLIEHKIDLGNIILPFSRQPDLIKVARPLFYQKDPFGPTEILFLVSREEFIQKNRAALVDFLEDYLRVLRWYLDPANHDNAVKTVAAFTKFDPRTIGEWLFTHEDDYRSPDGLVNLNSLQKTTDAEHQLGLIRSSADVRQFADLSLVSEAAQRLK